MGLDNHNKGADLERRFCEFMKNELGYKEAYTGTVQHSVNNPSGIKLDIMAKKNSPLGKRLKTISAVFSVIQASIIIFLIGFRVITNKFASNDFDIIGISSLILCIIFYKLADVFTTEYAWVECKDLQDKADINHVNKMLFEFNSNKKSKDRKQTFRHKYFVSANGFVYNAQLYAEQNEIICYICTDKGFEKTKLL